MLQRANAARVDQGVFEARAVGVITNGYIKQLAGMGDREGIRPVHSPSNQ